MILEYKNSPIFYTDEGEGRVVVLLHGFMENSTMWKDLTAEIKATHRIISIDLLGHGKTGCWGYVHTMEMMADAVVFVLGQLKISKSFFIGHSMGGYVALAIAEAYPERFYGMCLTNSTPYADSPERQINRDRAIKVVKQNPNNFISMSISNLFSPDNRGQFVEEIESIKLEAMEMPVQGIIAALEGMKIRKDRSVVLQQLTAKKMIVLGRQDPILDFTALKPQLAEIEVELVELSGGHMSHIENKSDYTYNIKRFIEN
ncbi:alpha/beta fold hydrolase [Gelidibacter maritimus]|uniref:Alpha/beta hydrolase n=1 Tax=Gelidibacter maritimus TaxID=2761487 RepID=A0A7W2R2H4_9FLAO|nr:alpha/beta hydrolase [Gelidibacter maritimus]MBA6151784.1 alpha/beta hydrolase [Gelidibacter maritimus]